MECVEELQHQRDLEDGQAHKLLYLVNYIHLGTLKVQIIRKTCITVLEKQELSPL